MPTLFPGFKKAEAVGTTLISFIFLGALPYPAGVTFASNGVATLVYC